VGWLERIQRLGPSESTDGATDESPPPPLERSSPGLAALFEPLSEDGLHSVLDLGHAGQRHLGLLSRYAQRIRFAGLIPKSADDEEWTAALRSVPPNVDHPYDVVLAWDLVDRLEPEERPQVMQRLAEVTAPGARLYTVVDTSGAATTRPLRFTLVDLGRVSQQAVGPPEPTKGQLLPAQVERVLAPFQVQHAFTLRTGLREYVAVKR
jgi:hypothetical protein